MILGGVERQVRRNVIQLVNPIVYGRVKERKMSCIKEGRFLFWKYKNISHSYEMIGIWKFMRSSTSFHVQYKCKGCGLLKEDSFVQPDELIIKGISAKTLNDVSINYVSLKPLKP
jgi:hypothetical protein